MREVGAAGSVTKRVDALDLALFEHITPRDTSPEDRKSLLALQAAIAARGDFRYLEVGSDLGATLQPFVADPRCNRIISIEDRNASSQDYRVTAPNTATTTEDMLRRLASVEHADLDKLAWFDVSTDELDPEEFQSDLCFINAARTNEAALRDARFCRLVIANCGVLVFHNRTLVNRGIISFLRELKRYRAYPLSHHLFVVEIGIPTLLTDSRVRAQVPRLIWLLVDRGHATPRFLRLTALPRRFEAALGWALLTMGAPRRRRVLTAPASFAPTSLFEIYTFVNDEARYEEMRESFVDAGFDEVRFIQLTDAHDDPYRAITRIGRSSTSRYPILCHQDVRLDRGAGAAALLAALEELDEVDPTWVVAGNAGITRRGRFIKRVVDRKPGSTIESLPEPVVTLDENFLVFNRKQVPRCSSELSGFHLYGSDVCLHALEVGGSGYVIDFPMSHLGEGLTGPAYLAAEACFAERWNAHRSFVYVPSTCGIVFISRSRALRKVFGSALAMRCISHLTYRWWQVF